MRSLLFFTALTLSLSACDLAPDAVIPGQRIPAQWNGIAMGDKTQATPAVTLEDFGSPELKRLIAEAVMHNTDLAQALARIEQARANTTIAGSGLYPTVDGSASADKTRSRSGGVTRNDSSQRAGLNVAYELDLWQKNRNLLDESLWGLSATRYDRDALALTVASEVARLYSGVLAYDARIQVAEQNLANAKEVLRITELRFATGAVSGLERSQQRTSVAGTEASITALRNQRVLFFNQLAQLTGHAPASFSLQGQEALKDLAIGEIPVSHPWELLERRPDIAASEARLRAANIDIGVARANALPGLSLSLDASVTGSPASSLVGLAASFFAPIFHGGALQADIERTTAVRDENIAAYEGTLLTAFREVGDALATYDAATKRRASLASGAAEAQEAYRIARLRFDAGSIDFTTLLDTQAAALSSDDSLLSASQEQLAAAIDLTRALGGGWNKEAAATAVNPWNVTGAL